MVARSNLLASVDLFEGVDEATIEKLFLSGKRTLLEDGEAFVRQGEFGDSFFLLLEGRAAIEVIGDDGRAKEVARLKEGQYFGELALVGRGERRATVRARGRAEALELRKIHFEHHLKKFKAVRQRLEDRYTHGALDAFIRQSRYFRELPAPELEELVGTATLESFSKDQVIAKEGEAAQKLYIVRLGFVRISRHTAVEDTAEAARGSGPQLKEEILAYLGPEDFFGDEEVSVGAQYGASAVAVEPVECMVVPRPTVWKLYLKHPEIFASFRRYSLARAQSQVGILQSKTAMGFVRDMLEAGLGQARSALIINLDTCVRCGNCVQACDDLHGYSRIARRGKKMTRRKTADATAHENLYFPTSCLQCATPECMVGCPTGAIARDVGGEVYIKDTCIGCGNCARNCDFGNIAMAKVKEDEVSILDLVLGNSSSANTKKKERVPLDRAATALQKPEDPKPELVAVKCDVCFEREFAACVYNCPVEAVLRIDPRSYFDELQRLAPKLALRQGAPTVAKTTTHRGRALGGAVVLQFLALVGSSVGAYFLHQHLRPTSWSGPGLWAGVAAAIMIGLLGVLGFRKRLRTHRLGSLATWARLHALLGGLLFGVVLFHSGFQATSVLTATLLGLLATSTAVGLGGQLASLLIPRLLARTEDEALLPEDVGPRIEALLHSNEEFLAGLEAKVKERVARQASRLVEGGTTYLRRGTSPQQLPKELEKRAKKFSPLSESEHALSLRIAENLARARLLRVRTAFEIILTSWQPIHLVSSAMAIMLLMGHLMTVLLW
jgi:CRP-like cAMP-binding protein/Fe-S-cluster-containing hydrogenase component 2